MKKTYAILFTVIALLAMSAGAFAADGDLIQFEPRFDIGTGGNNMGAFHDAWAATPPGSMDITAPLYYYPTPVLETSSAWFEARFICSADNSAYEYPIFASTTKEDEIFTPKNLGHGSKKLHTRINSIRVNGKFWGDVSFTIENVRYDQIPAGAKATLTGFAGYEWQWPDGNSGLGQEDPVPAAHANITLIFTPVSFMFTSGDAEPISRLTIENTASEPIDFLVLSNDLGQTIEYVYLVAGVINADGTFETTDAFYERPLAVPGLGKVDIDPQDNYKFTVIPSNPKPGRYKLAIMGKANTYATIVFNNYKVSIAGLNGPGGSPDDSWRFIIAELDVDVIRKVTKNATPKTLIMKEYAIENLVISTDISTTDVAPANSTDIKISMNAVDPVPAASYDLSLRNGDYYNVTIGADALKTLGVGEYIFQVYDKTEAYSTNTVTLTIDATSEAVVDEPSTEQQTAIDALVAGSIDLDLVGATQHAAINGSTDVPSELSNDVRGYFSIDQKVDNDGDYIAIDGTKLVARKDAGEIVTFFKNFGSSTDPDLASLAGAMSGDVLEAAVLIVDNEVPSTVKDALKSSKDAKKGVVIRKVNGTNVVVIYDGAKNGKVNDPIEARVNRGSSSSSGACSMGFGLVAIAGLAALALRKLRK